MSCLTRSLPWPLRHVLRGWCLGVLGLGMTAAAPAGAAWHWTYEAVGDDAPRHEHFVVRADAVDWLDGQRRTLWRFEPGNGRLVAFDPSQGSRLAIDADAIQAMADSLTHVQSLGLGREPARPWAALEAADRWTDLPAPGGPTLAPCRRLALQAGARTVGETCVADGGALPGGPALLQMLQALAALSDAVRQRQAGNAAADWPQHPLVVAARAGGIPLWVRQQLPGERPREWRLAGRPTADLAR